MVGPVVQAVAILRHLAAARTGEGVSAIARAIGIGPSSCFNVLKTLVAEDLVTFDTQTKRYALSLGIVDLARGATGRDAVLRAAQARLSIVAQRHDAAVGLWRLAPHERLVLMYLAESAAATRIHMLVGQRQPAAAGATGRAVLAARGMDDAAITAAYERITWPNPPGLPAFLDQVRAAREHGYATDVDQIHRGVATAAAAVTERNGGVRFVLSASIFAGHGPLDAIAGDLRDAAAELSALESHPRD